MIEDPKLRTELIDTLRYYGDPKQWSATGQIWKQEGSNGVGPVVQAFQPSLDLGATARQVLADYDEQLAKEQEICGGKGSTMAYLLFRSLNILQKIRDADLVVVTALEAEFAEVLNMLEGNEADDPSPKTE